MGFNKVRATLGLMLILLIVTEAVDGSGLGGGAAAVKQQSGGDKCFNDCMKKCVGKNCSCYCQLECFVPPVRKVGRRGGGGGGGAVKQQAGGGDKCFHHCMKECVGQNCSCYCELECYVPPVRKVGPLP